LAMTLLSGAGACTWNNLEPAPVIQKDLASSFDAGPAMARPMPPVAENRVVVVRPGQSLRGIAHAQHVSERTLIAANHLRPPYELKTGQRLIIPGEAGGPIRTASLPPPTISEQPLSPPPAPPPAANASAAREVIPLDAPSPARNAAPPPSHTAGTLSPPSGPAGSSGPPHEPSAAEEARAESERTASLPHGGRFSWPVRGRVLSGYGVAAGGAHNDGINIAAPRGAPVAAVDAGEVAYAGNELRGYGNLVLIKHANGWITAYAHCEELLVKKGDKVSRGQVIAKVGTTGGVSEPQLHFELRRGKRPVDPKEFLTPAPSASAAEPAPRG